jgi:hypothetical protein
MPGPGFPTSYGMVKKQVIGNKTIVHILSVISHLQLAEFFCPSTVGNHTALSSRGVDNT